MILLVGSIFGAIPAVSAIGIGVGGAFNLWLLVATMAAFGIGAAIGAFGVAHSVTRIDNRGLARLQRNGNFSPLKRLERGQRFVIVKRCLCVQGDDGTIENIEIAKWRIRRGDWERVAQEYSDIDATESPKPRPHQ
ncbi:hypothetical protein [Glycomyces arizonensis]|uniref:hypothetical protein n=1 Tax=Glycomyces arizonensis TaxID=256035 RepID=UPI0012EC7190|nr:hypothetical protein [Glycomyces arizonensis]